MAINLAPIHVVTLEPIIFAGQQTHVIDLRDARNKELNRARDQIGLIITA